MDEPDSVVCGGDAYAYSGMVVRCSLDGAECDYCDTEKA